MPINFFRALNLHLTEHTLQVLRELKVGIHRRSINVRPMHLVHRLPRVRQPSLVPVESRNTFSVRQVRERYPHVRRLRINLDRHVFISEGDRPLHHPAVDFLDRRRSPNRLQIFVEQLIGWRARFFLLATFRFLGFLRARLRLFRHHYRRRHRIGTATVAGVASHLAMALEVLLINGEHHLHHFPRHQLRLLVVLLERALHMTKLALHAERSGNELHRRNQLIRRNPLEGPDVLELLLCLLRRRGTRRLGRPVRLRLRTTNLSSTNCQDNPHPHKKRPDLSRHHFPLIQNHGSLPNSNAAQKTAPYPSPPAPPHRKIPPSFPPTSGRPRSPACPDRGCADYSLNCHTKPPPAAWSPPSIPEARPACNSTASESDNSPAAAAPRAHRHAQCHIQTASPADACAETNSEEWHRSAAFPAPPRENRPPLEESTARDYSTAA